MFQFFHVVFIDDKKTIDKFHFNKVCASIRSFKDKIDLSPFSEILFGGSRTILIPW